MRASCFGRWDLVSLLFIGSSGRCHLLPDLLLWLRLRPGGERFVIFMQVRSALMVLCKLVVLNMLLYVSLIAMTVSQPW